MEGKKNEYGLVQEIELARCKVELDGAEGGFAWFSDDNDALVGVEFKEFPKLIEFLKQFIK